MNKLFKALADPNRRKILQLLRKSDMHVNQILEYFSITQASLSYHLEVLRNAKLVVSEKKGQFVRYSINTTVFEECIALLYSFLKE